MWVVGGKHIGRLIDEFEEQRDILILVNRDRASYLLDIKIIFEKPFVGNGAIRWYKKDLGDAKLMYGVVIEK